MLGGMVRRSPLRRLLVQRFCRSEPACDGWYRDCGAVSLPWRVLRPAYKRLTVGRIPQLNPANPPI